MITCTKLEFVKTDDDGNKWWKVILTATEEPTKLDLDGTDVDDIASNVRFAAGSVLIAPSSNYIALEDGVFTLKSTGGGGGGGGGGVDENTPGIKSITVTYDGDDITSYGTITPALPIYDAGDGNFVDISFTAAGAPDGEYEVTITPTQASKIAYIVDPEDPSSVVYLETGEPWTLTIVVANAYGEYPNEAALIDANTENPVFAFYVAISTENPK